MILTLGKEFKEVIEDFLGKKKLLCSIKLTDDRSKAILQISDIYTVQRFIPVLSVSGGIEEISFNMTAILHLLVEDGDIRIETYPEFIKITQGTFSVMMQRESEEVIEIKVTGLSTGQFSVNKMLWILGRFKALLPITKEQAIAESPLLFVKGNFITYYNSILYKTEMDFIDCAINYGVFNTILRKLSGTCTYYYSEKGDTIILTSDKYVFICAIDRGSFLYDVYDRVIKLNENYKDVAEISIAALAPQLEILVKEITKQLVTLYIYKDSVGVNFNNQNTNVSIGIQAEPALLFSEVSIAQLDAIVRIFKDATKIKILGGKNLCLKTESQMLMLSGMIQLA